MTEKTKDQGEIVWHDGNPPAFPRDHRYLGHNGMDLRDWFAGQALAGGLIQHHGYPLQSEDIAHSAYTIADAMLEHRKEKSHG